MKFAVGTPIHDSKEYGVYRWLDSMKALSLSVGDSMDFHIIDTSDMEAFTERVREYIIKIDLFPVYLVHLPEMAGKEDEARRMWGREAFRTGILASDAEVWLSWECDILVEPDALNALALFLNVFDIVSSTYPSRMDPTDIAGGIGFSLFKRNVLETFSFLDGGGYAMCNPNKPSCYYSGDSWLIQRAMGAGFKYAEFTNLIKIEHLMESDGDA